MRRKSTVKKRDIRKKQKEEKIVGKILNNKKIQKSTSVRNQYFRKIGNEIKETKSA